MAHAAKTEFKTYPDLAWLITKIKIQWLEKFGNCVLVNVPCRKSEIQ